MDRFQEFQISNAVVRRGLQMLPQGEQTLILEIYGDGMTRWRFCKKHLLSRKRFDEIESHALARLRIWLTENRVRALCQIL